MIKIHAGKYKGNFINRVKIKTTKETASMVREAVFNSLYNIHGTILDLFAGSGSYGITALSLGASNAYFVENNNRAYNVVKENLKKLDLKANVFKCDYKTFLNRNKTKFDFIFLDPPYNFNNYEQLLLDVKNHLNNQSYIILEVDKRTKINFDKYNNEVIKDKNYGSKRIIIFFFK